MIPSSDPPSRRPGVLAAHSVHEFVFSVPDLAAARQFYESFGLDVRDEDGALGLYTFGNPHRWGRILRGAVKRLLWITWGVFADDLKAFHTRIETLHVPRIPRPVQAGTEGDFWIAGPDGLAHQIVVAEKTSPSHKAARIFPPESSTRGRSPHRNQIWTVQPRRLSHILLFSPDVDLGLAFYENVLGLRLSDRSGSIIAFIHTPHGSDHHLIAIAKSGGYGLHHCSWDVASIDDVGLGSQQMANAGHPRGWGLGRHVLGSNYFRYVRDPWGGYAEYSFDIDYVSANVDWPAGDYPPEDSLYVWGPPVPDDFIVNYELQSDPECSGSAGPRHSGPVPADQ
ncbi:VOC family protein [Castellaniella sp. UC4442_H9]|jgi:catechol 2,3-dioxygenase-like lactoylglutathione lyase family enzyme|nr:VOC family protein [Castellaniella sp.]